MSTIHSQASHLHQILCWALGTWPYVANSWPPAYQKDRVSNSYRRGGCLGEWPGGGHSASMWPSRDQGRGCPCVPLCLTHTGSVPWEGAPGQQFHHLVLPTPTGPRFWGYPPPSLPILGPERWPLISFSTPGLGRAAASARAEPEDQGQ